jgi:maleylacetate reductase
MNVTAAAALPFDVPFPSRTFVGAGVANRAGTEFARLGVQNVGIVTSRSVSATEAFKLWLASFNPDSPVFSATEPHTPREIVIEAARFFRVRRCDALVSFGGGSAIDTTKGVALALAGEIEGVAEFDRFKGEWSEDGTSSAFDIKGSLPTHISIPTTLSGASHTFGAGISDRSRGVKFVHRHPGLGPRVVLLDPLVTLDTPRSLWTGTGMKALEHAVEALYSRLLAPFAEPLRARAFRILTNDLVPSVDLLQPDIVQRRARVLAGAGMSVLSPSPLGISHALGHQAGAAWSIPHGNTTSIFLPAALAFNAPVAGNALRTMADAIGADGSDPLEFVLSKLEEITQALALPRRLRDADVRDTSRFDEVAAATLRDSIMLGNPRPASQEDVVGLLRAVY